MNENFWLKEKVDKYLFECGFNILLALQGIFSFYLRDGKLAHGEDLRIKIILNGEIFDVDRTEQGEHIIQSQIFRSLLKIKFLKPTYK